MSEILGLKIHAETVVLSACNGEGKVMHAEGVMSLGRAFMAAGAEKRYRKSCGKLQDTISTQMLMEEYYKNLVGGKSKAEALSIARSSLFAEGNSFKNPYFLAPFVPDRRLSEDHYFELNCSGIAEIPLACITGRFGKCN